MAKERKPKVLSEYEIGRCMSAIDAVVMLGKPIAEVMSRKAKLQDLRSDLQNCIRLSRKRKFGVKVWIKKSGTRFRYGFYRHSWARKALNSLDDKKFSDFDRDWISGLLFGYQPNQIQRFIDKKGA